MGEELTYYLRERGVRHSKRYNRLRTFEVDALEITVLTAMHGSEKVGDALLAALPAGSRFVYCGDYYGKETVFAQRSNGAPDDEVDNGYVALVPDRWFIRACHLDWDEVPTGGSFPAPRQRINLKVRLDRIAGIVSDLIEPLTTGR